MSILAVPSTSSILLTQLATATWRKRQIPRAPVIVRITQDVMTTFTWTLGGNTVFLTGTFTNWSNHIPLQKDGHIFTRTIVWNCVKSATRENDPSVQPVWYASYKFIVDGDWRFSPEDPTTTDEKGNINNTVDLTNYKALSNNAMKNGSQDISYEASRIIESKKDKPLVSFEQFNETAPKLPSLFTSCPYLDVIFC